MSFPLQTKYIPHFKMGSLLSYFFEDSTEDQVLVDLAERAGKISGVMSAKVGRKFVSIEIVPDGFNDVVRTILADVHPDNHVYFQFVEGPRQVA